MRKIILTSLLILTLILAGCSAPQASQTSQTEETSDKIDSEEVSKEADSRVLKTIEKKDTVPNIIYEYSRPPQDAKVYIYHINGNKAKVILPKFNLYLKEKPALDTVYLGLSSKTAQGYCEFRDICASRKMDSNQGFEVPFVDYYQKNPYEWLQDIPTSAMITGTEQISTRDTTVLEYQDAGVKKKVWVDDFYGVPLRVQITTPLEEYSHTFKIIDIGRVKTTDLEHVQQSGLRR